MHELRMMNKHSPSSLFGTTTNMMDKKEYKNVY